MGGDVVKNDVKALGGVDWRIQASDRENRRQGLMLGWSQWLTLPEKEEETIF